MVETRRVTRTSRSKRASASRPAPDAYPLLEKIFTATCSPRTTSVALDDARGGRRGDLADHVVAPEESRLHRRARRERHVGERATEPLELPRGLLGGVLHRERLERADEVRERAAPLGRALGDPLERARRRVRLSVAQEERAEREMEGPAVGVATDARFQRPRRLRRLSGGDEEVRRARGLSGSLPRARGLPAPPDGLEDARRPPVIAPPRELRRGGQGQCVARRTAGTARSASASSPACAPMSSGAPRRPRRAPPPPRAGSRTLARRGHSRCGGRPGRWPAPRRRRADARRRAREPRRPPSRPRCLRPRAPRGGSS